jgi:hypothetical protein
LLTLAKVFLQLAVVTNFSSSLPLLFTFLEEIDVVSLAASLVFILACPRFGRLVRFYILVGNWILGSLLEVVWFERLVLLTASSEGTSASSTPSQASSRGSRLLIIRVDI